MSAAEFSAIFLAMLAITTALRLLLAVRHMRYVAAHRDRVPAEFTDAIELPAHRKAADYTVARVSIALAEIALGAIGVLLLTVGGLLQWLYDLLAGWFEGGGYTHGVLLMGLLTLLSLVVELPFTVYRVFVIEERFGFNRMTWRTFIADLFKQGVLAILIGVPVLLVALWLMHAGGALWWLWVWMFWLGFNLLALLIYPSLIAPLFNKFEPLRDEALRQRVEALLERCGFRASGLFVMDGSRRSSHGNAYFTGFGASKRIVFFDTLLERLQPPEVEAVLAHEIGHFRLHHIWKRVAMLAAGSLAFLALLGFLVQQPWFFGGLGVESHDSAVALVLFALAIPVFTFPFSPLLSHMSRRHEFEADAYAARHARGRDLVSALVKLYRDNAATLTPDPLYSAFYDSHPPAAVRVARLSARTAPASTAAA
ncbi:MAG: M48 family metallopeptidase [Betaproteobacteria bacterium]|nr:M48 family metallopeptidase [Betaproteobacteria bacterium]